MFSPPSFRRRKNLFHARHSETCTPPSPQPCTEDNNQLTRSQHQLTGSQRAKAAKMLYAQTLPSQQQQTNHYIEDFHHQSRVVAMTVARSQQQQRSMMPLPDANQLISGSGHQLTGSQQQLTRTRMELASQPPPSQNVYHNFPHIIIGGQPFYLIPSDPEDCVAFETGDPSYAYPQNVAPIYEEIDPDHEEGVANAGNIWSQMQTTAGHLATTVGGHNPTKVQARNSRVVTSDVASSEYSSVQSDQGEAGSDTSSLKRPKMQPQRAPLGRLVVNPMEQQQHQNQLTGSQHQLTGSQLRRMPPHRSPASSTGSSSMYYYSDTMKNPTTKQPNRQGVPQRLSDDFSDSGFSHRSNSKRNNGGGLVKQGLGSSSSNSESVDTKVVVEKDEDAGSTLV